MTSYSIHAFKLYILLILALVALSEKNSEGQTGSDTSGLQTQVPDTFDYFSGDKDLNLCTAAFDGNAKAVLGLLNKGASMNYSTDGLTALHYAILNGHLKVVKILVLNGAGINRITDDGITPLILAVQNGEDEITDFLCQNGAAIDSTDYRQRTALMIAVANGSFLLTDILLYYGADPLKKDFDGNDAIMVASFSNQPNLGSDLRNYGADVNTKDNYNNTPLIVAAEKGYSEMADSLLSWGADASLKNKSGFTALAKAIISNNIETVKILINRLVSLNENIRPGILPLDLARHYPSIDSLLRKEGAHRSLFPDYHEILIGFDFSSNFSDYMNNIHLGLYDPKFYTTISLGFHTRMAAMKLYVPKSESLWYQYLERRYYIWAGIDKQFPVYYSTRKNRSGIDIGLKSGYTFGNYHGSNANAASEWLLVPSVQLFHSGRYHTISLGYEYAKYPCFELSPHHITASIKFHLPTRREAHNFKNIDWIQINQ